MKVYFFSNVTLGYGNPEYINLAAEIFKGTNESISFIEPIDKERVFFDMEHSFIIRNALLLKAGNFFRKFPGGWVSRALMKAASKIGVAWQVLLFLADREKKVLVTSRYHPLLSLTSKKVKIYFYCSEIFEIEDNSGFFFEKYKKKVSTIIAPQFDRLELLKKIFPSCASYLVQNCPAKQKNSAAYTYNQKAIIYQGRIGALSNAEEIILLAKNAPDDFKLHLAGPIDKEFKREVESLHKSGKLYYHGYLNSEDLNNLRKKMSFGLVTWGEHDLNTKYCAPNKLYEYIAEGLVVVAFENYSVRDLNEKYNFGFISSDGHKSVIQFVDTMLEKEHRVYSENNIEKYRSELNFENQSKKLVEDIVNEISIS